MIIKVSRDRVDDVASLLDKAGVRFSVVRIYGDDLVITWPDSKIDVNAVKSVDPNAVIIEVKAKYQLASNAWRDRTIVDVSGVKIGGDEVVVAAGPCAVESYEQVRDTAIAVKEAGGAKLLRGGGAFKPRTNPYSFQGGLGVDGLKILRRVGDEVGLPVVSEVMDTRMVKTVAEYVDMLQIGARNAQNFDLLREVGRSGKPVLLKRGLGNTVEEWLQAAEYILLEGNGNVVSARGGV